MWYPKVIVAFYIILGILVCINIAFTRIISSDFFPIDGDFQNYNGYRRLFDGQIPFKDFYYYLGLGPLFSNSFFLLFIGNNFTNSLFITNFVSSIMLFFAVYAISRSNHADVKRSLIISLIIVLSAVSILPYIQWFNFLQYVYPGNSDRMVRAFLPFLMVIMAPLLVDKHIVAIRKRFHLRNKDDLIKPIVLGAILGGCVAWSNDYGISSFIAGTFIYLLIDFKRDKRSLLKIAALMISGLISCFLVISIFTLGHFGNWFSYNFLGVASEQFYYFETSARLKLLSLSDIPFDFTSIVSIVIILYLSFKIRFKKHTTQDIKLLFLFLSTLIAGYAYAFGSAKYGMFLPLQMVLFISALSRIIQFSKKAISDMMIIAVAISLLVPAFQTTYDKMHSERKGYVPELHGYLNVYADELMGISDNLIKDKKMFSTYASALEVMNGTFQPSGIDYIIHVLGDKQRNHYMQAFLNSKPDYVTTVREDFNHYEIWAKRANWYFYREVLKRYHPIAMTPYSMVWEPSDSPRVIKAEVGKSSINRISDNTLEVLVEMKDATLNNVVLEAKLSYSTKWNANRWKGLGLRKLISIGDGWSDEWDKKAGTYNLPDKGENQILPFRIQNGKGKLVIRSFPEKLTLVDINRLSFLDVVPDVNFYDLGTLKVYSIIQAANVTDVNWKSGVNQASHLILLQNRIDSLSSLQSAHYILTKSGTKLKIKNIIVIDSSWVHVLMEPADLSELEFPNRLDLVSE